MDLIGIVRFALAQKGRNFWHLSPEGSVYDAIEIMADKRIRHLPVVQDEKILGMASIGDLVKWMLSAQQQPSLDCITTSTVRIRVKLPTGEDCARASPRIPSGRADQHPYENLLSARQH